MFYLNYRNLNDEENEIMLNKKSQMETPKNLVGKIQRDK